MAKMALSFAVILSRMPLEVKGLIYGFGSAIPKAIVSNIL